MQPKKSLRLFRNMRLSHHEVNCIKETAAHHFGADASLWLFGSRIDDSKRGGDIDLYVETTIDNARQATGAKLAFLMELQEKIGEQKIDLVVKYAGSRARLKVVEVAKKTGIRL